MKSIVLLAAVATLCCLTACSGASPDESAQGDDAALTAVSLADVEVGFTVGFEPAKSVLGQTVAVAWTPHDGKRYVGIKVSQGFDNGRYFFSSSAKPGAHFELEMIAVDSAGDVLKRARVAIALNDQGSGTEGFDLAVDRMKVGTYYLLLRDVAGNPLAIDVDVRAAEPLPAPTANPDPGCPNICEG